MQIAFLLLIIQDFVGYLEETVFIKRTVWRKWSSGC